MFLFEKGVFLMWCKKCNRETDKEKCELCGDLTEQEIPLEVYWCDHCKVPIIKAANSIDKNLCTICGVNTGKRQNFSTYFYIENVLKYPSRSRICFIGLNYFLSFNFK